MRFNLVFIPLKWLLHQDTGFYLFNKEKNIMINFSIGITNFIFKEPIVENTKRSQISSDKYL